MKSGKYVIFEHRDTFMPILFPEHITHSMISLKDSEAVSAGFFKTTKTGIEIYGRSYSMNLEPNKQLDSRLIEMAIEGHSNTTVYMDY